MPRLGTVAAGAVGIVLFPDPDLGVLAWVAFVPLLLLLRASRTRREAMLRGWLGGLGFVTATLYWLVPNLVYFFPLAAAVVAMLWLPWGLLVWALLRPGAGDAGFGWRRALPALVAVPSGWVLIETVRSWKPFGGPWSLLGASQWDHPAELGLASVGGAWLLTFAIMLTNTCVALLILARVPVKVACAGLGAAAVVAGPVWFATHPLPSPAGAAALALVQPGIVHDPQARDEQGIALTRALAGRHVDLVVWGESSGADGLAGLAADREQIEQLSARLGAPILVDANSAPTDGDLQKVSYLYTASGVTGQYAKTRLVMFGEYIPFTGELHWLTKLTKAAGVNLVPGGGLTVMSAGGIRIGPLICFESAFPDMARTEVVHGARLLVYQSEDSTFQGSWEPAQHASLSAVRAAETGRPAVQASLAGVSAAFDAQGRELAWLSKDAVGSVVARVPLQTADTPYDRYGNYVPIACAVLLAAAVPFVARMRLLSDPPRPAVARPAAPTAMHDA
jgi:apolipoprotein N-acyltransferase